MSDLRNKNKGATLASMKSNLEYFFDAMNHGPLSQERTRVEDLKELGMLGQVDEGREDV